jgi:hypothetical protein
MALTRKRFAARTVKKFMRPNCNTSTTRQGANDGARGFWVLPAYFVAGEQNVTFSLVVSRCENDG